MSHSYPLISRDDLNAFWALFADNLANFIIIAGLTLHVVQIPEEVVFGRIFPGLGVALIVGLSFYTWLARRLASHEGRDDVTALPYGISTPVLFVYVFGVMMPVKAITGDATLAWQVGIAAAFVGGVLEALGSVVGPFLKRVTPRAGMLGTLAGIALVWIGAIHLAEVLEHPLIAFPSLVIVFVGLVAGARLPFGAPAGLVAIAVGTAIGLVQGVATIEVGGIQPQIPVPLVGDLVAGLQALFVDHPTLLATVIPIEIYNFIETMNNVESAEAAGDAYPVRSCQVMDGVGTMTGALFGSAFPTTVYIGHPGYKRLGGRAGYTLLVGGIFVLASFLGLLSFLHHLIPLAAVAPMLVFIAMVICGQAFTASPAPHAAAVTVALMPHVSSLLVTKIQGVAGTVSQLHGVTLNLHAPEMLAALLTQGVHLTGHTALSQGAIVTGLIWGAMTAHLIDRRFMAAAAFALAGSAGALVGLIHAPAFGWYPGEVFWGYLVMTGVIAALAAWSREAETT